MRNSSLAARESGNSAATGLGRISQQILNMFEHAGARAAERRELSHLDRRHLDDCGLTPADVEVALQDIYANDFRVAHIGEQRAA